MKTYIYLFDDLVEIELDVEYEAIYRAARTYGPAEDCYPEESELTLVAWPTVSTRYFGDLSDIPEITQDMIDIEVERAYSRIVDKCWDDFHERAFERRARTDFL
jgi:hypothetical protein